MRFFASTIRRDWVRPIGFAGLAASGARRAPFFGLLVAAAVLFVGGCGGSSSVVPTCTLDGQTVDDCYAAESKSNAAMLGDGAVFGISELRGTPGTAGFVAFYFDATTISRGASTFPGPNNAMAYSIVSAATCDGIGSATWHDDGAMFCVTTQATCEASTVTTHVACVPSSMMR